MRTPDEILRRAIVMTAVAFRHSLEASDDTRCEQLSRQLLPWLEEHGIAGDIDPIERDILAMAYGQLDRSQRIDMQWSGEGASIMCWALGLTSQPPDCEHVFCSRWFELFDILRGDPPSALSDIAPRSLHEISQFHVRMETLRTALQLARTEPSLHPMLRKICLMRLSEIGIQAGDEEIDQAVERVATYSLEQRSRATGLCLPRSVATSWLIDGRARYFDNEEEAA